MRDITVKIKTFFSKSYTSNPDVPYAWYNTQTSVLSEDQIDSLVNYFEQHNEIDKMIIVNNVMVARPQRTWGGFPEFFRPATQLNTFPPEGSDNSFVLMLYDNYDKKEIEEGLSTFPQYAEILKFYK